MHQIGASSPPGAESAPTDYSTSFNKCVYDAIPGNKICLDVGCSAGNLGNALVTTKGCSVDGIETNPQAAAVAKSRGYGNVFVRDLNREPDLQNLGDAKYDVIICADVLEHLASPGSALVQLSKHLRPGGIFVISLPNVAFVLNRLHLLFGRWDYKEFGILDRTHLRFYTIKTGGQMVEAAGLDVVAVKPYNQFGVLRYISPLDRCFPALLAYQFLVIAKQANNE